MVIVGLIGGIASGKSFVASEFERLGAKRIDADQLGHDVLRNPDVVKRLVSRWGDQVLDATGAPNRSAIAEIVFSRFEKNAKELKFLEDVTHPKIAAEVEKLLREYEKQGVPVVILDAALLIEAGWNQLCDVIVFVDAKPELRLARAVKRGWTKEQFEQRESAQLPLAQKRRFADILIDNSGKLEETREQVQRIWNQLVKTTE